MVAARFQVAGYATLLMDLLTPEEEQIDNRTRTLRFDIPRLASRLTGAIRWLTDQTATGSLPVALFGASTGAAAALRAAAEVPQLVQLVISRGGRPDLAGEALERVRVPTLLIVGGRDVEVLALNEGRGGPTGRALGNLRCAWRDASVRRARDLGSCRRASTGRAASTPG